MTFALHTIFFQFLQWNMSFSGLNIIPSGNDMFKVNNKNFIVNLLKEKDVKYVQR